MTDMKALDQKALEAAEAAFGKSCGGLLDGRPMANAIAAYLAVAEAVEPVAYRVKDFADGWILTHSKAEADYQSREMSGALIQPLFASPPSPASSPKVTVKPLEWVKHPTAEAWRCDTIVGLYQVFAMTAGHASWTLDGLPAQGTGGYEDDGDKAKAAAQSDYEARITAALSPDLAVKVEAGKPDAS